MSRDFGAELDVLRTQIEELRELVLRQMKGPSVQQTQNQEAETISIYEDGSTLPDESGQLFFSGEYRGGKLRYKWEPQERRVSRLLALDGGKAAKVLSALGHKQRIDILRAVLQEPLTGAEIVDRLGMGTTGQLYHHIKALQGADLLTQEERGGAYAFPEHRALPFLLLLAASAELLDTSEYLELTEARNEAGAYLGNGQQEYDPNLLLLAVLENSIAEHRAGYCSSVSIVFHSDGSVTAADNGRGIPVQALPGSDKPRVQAVLTEISRHSSASIVAPDGKRGISIPIVNALSQRLTVEVRREGKAFRQEYKHGIPQTPLLTIGLTNETGTSLTFLPDKDIFRTGFDPSRFAEELATLSNAFPKLKLQLLADAHG